MQNPQLQAGNLPQTGQSFEQRDRVKQGGLDIDHDMEHHEGSTMNTLSVENLSSSNIDHDATEILHKGWEKATDSIAAGMEVVKRIIMHELPPVEGENLKEKAENLKEKASEKIQEVKEKVQDHVESTKQEAQRSELPRERGSRTSDQTDLYRSGSGSTRTWEPTQQMKDVAREKLGEYKEKYQIAGRKESGHKDNSAPAFQSQQESATLIEQGKEKELSASSNNTIQEIEGLSHELNQKVEELKRSANLPTNNAAETIIIIQEGAPEQGQPQFESRENFSDQISRKAQELKEGYKQGFDKGFGSHMPSSEGGQTQQQERPKLGHRGEQQWRNQPKEHHDSEHHLTTESKSFKPSPQGRSLLEHELPSNEGHQEHEHHLTASSESFQPSGEGKSLIKKELFSGNQGGQGNLESQAGKLKEKLGAAAEQIKEKVLPSGEESQGKPLKEQIYNKIDEVAEKIMPLDEAEKQYNQSHSEKHKTSAPPAEMKEAVTYHPHDIRGYEIEYVPKYQNESQGEKEGPKDEEPSKPLQERIPFLDRLQHGLDNASHKYHNIVDFFKPREASQGGQTSEETGYHEEHLRTGPPPTEIKENITYHPRDIKGYEIEYVPKHEGEDSQSQGHSQRKNSQNLAAPVEMKEAITYHPRDIRGYEIEYVPKSHEEGQDAQPEIQGAPQEIHENFTYHPREISGYEVEYVPKQHEEGEQPEGQKSEQPSEGDRVALLDRVQHGLGSIKGLFHHGQGEEKQSLSKAPESGSELSKILESQSEVLKTKYSALRDDQPHGEELTKSEPIQKDQEGQEDKGGKGLFGRVSGALHSITDRFSHGAGHIEGKIVEEKEEPKKAESPREKIYEFNPKAKKAEEKPAESEENSAPGLVSRLSDRFSHGLEGMKERLHHNKEEEEASTEKNQSVFEKIQGKIQGKQTGEEVDKQGFKKVHDGFSETVDELKHEQNEQYLDQIHIANENPFEPLRTKQAALINLPVGNNDLVGGDLKKMTADFDETKQEMIPDDEEKKRGLLQKMKDGLFSKFGHGNKENEESS